VSNAGFALCCQNARIQVPCDSQRAPIPDQVRLGIARLALAIHGAMHRPEGIEIGTCVDRVGRSPVNMTQGMFPTERHVAATQLTVARIDPATRRPALSPETAGAIAAIAGSRSRNHPLWHQEA
jgi:acyl-CoA thioesterase FadM